MAASLGNAGVSQPQSPFPPLAVSFFGLGTRYLIWGPQELPRVAVALNLVLEGTLPV